MKKAVLGPLVCELLKSGVAQNKVQEQLGCSKSLVSHYARRLGLTQPQAKSSFDWQEIEAYRSKGHTRSECVTKFNMTWSQYRKAIQRGDLTKEKPKRPFLEMTRSGVRGHLLKAGRGIECEQCRITKWNGKTLTMDLHHINGLNDDHRLENLIFLCPNCHSQTPNFKAHRRV